MLLFILACLLLGAVVGVLAGLLGIGGGLIVVPALAFLLPKAGVLPQHLMPIALGTSLASIVLTGISSSWRHHQLGNVDWKIVKAMIPGGIIGAVIGAHAITLIPSAMISKVFGVLVLILALQMAWSVKIIAVHSLPSKKRLFTAGTLIGVFSSLAGIGGGSLTVPYLNWHSVSMRTAIGISAVCSMMLGVGGSLTLILSGLHEPNLPAYSLGYVYLPALFCIALTSIQTSKVGANLVSRLPVPTLKKGFAVLLILVAFNMLW
ncbi:MAG: sulfite exporter TauE/SafE family protein [Plesiomonas sp.]|uniref:sulfite exporter TauE/SafE family protein n=1 Tax=Plesiomonas sp. TaxID=2486279 RepID=UPI003F2A77E3